MKYFSTKTSLLVLSSIALFLFIFAGCVTTPIPSPSNKEPVSRSTKPHKKLSKEILEINTSSGAKQKFLLIKPAEPTALVILFDGGYGKQRIEKRFGQIQIESKGFLARNSDVFAENGFVVALVDAPSNKQSKGIYPDFRMSKEHAQDIDLVISYLIKKVKLPVWIVGMSTGTFSAANAAIQSNREISGIVLAASSTLSYDRWPKYETYPKGVLSMELNKIKVPTLMVAHENDKCFVSPPSDAFKMKQALVNSPKAEVLLFKGGKKPKQLNSPVPSDCQPLTPHGFYGIEKRVIDAIAGFINANSK
jgi:dienelactone hydrolase